MVEFGKEANLTEVGLRRNGRKEKTILTIILRSFGKARKDQLLQVEVRVTGGFVLFNRNDYVERMKFLE